MLILQNVAGLTLSVGEIIQVGAAVLVAGGLIVQIRFNGKRIDKIEEHYDKQRESDQKAQKDALDRIEARAAERCDKVEGRVNKLEERFLGAIEKLGDSMANLTTRLETVVGIHETRLDALDRHIKE